MGAWIETAAIRLHQMSAKKSHPVWVRGLKQVCYWVYNRVRLSHPVWVRGLKLVYLISELAIDESHPVWVRGLKLQRRLTSVSYLGRTLYGCVD